MTGKVKIGLFGIGLDTYWSQFDGLFEKLKLYHLRIKDQLINSDAEVVNAGGSFSEFYGMDFNDDIILMGHDGRIALLTAHGYSVEGPTLQIGNTNSRYKFPVSAREFINGWSKAGPSHHCAIGTGHISSRINKLSELLNIGFEMIC
jgi:L-arabinose isomerase